MCVCEGGRGSLLSAYRLYRLDQEWVGSSIGTITLLQSYSIYGSFFFLLSSSVPRGRCRLVGVFFGCAPSDKHSSPVP